MDGCDSVTTGIGPIKSAPACSVIMGAGIGPASVTAGIGPTNSGDGDAITMGADSFGKSSADDTISSACSSGGASSAFRISMAPVSISVAVLAGAVVSAPLSLAVVGATGWWFGAAISFAASNSFNNAAASPSLAPASPGKAVLSAISADGASPAIRIAAAGSGGLPSSDPGCICRAWLSAKVSPPSTLPGCGVCIIANRLANNARVSASAPRFSPGASPFGERVWPVPSASIVFISMPRSLLAIGQNLCAKKRKSCSNAAKRVPESPAVQRSSAAARGN